VEGGLLVVADTKYEYKKFSSRKGSFNKKEDNAESGEEKKTQKKKPMK
jgi:hypothetical protein